MDYMKKVKFETSMDRFYDLPKEAQVLYFHMVMNATGNGQTYNVQSLKKILNVDDDTPHLLESEGFISSGYSTEDGYPEFYNITALQQNTWGECC